MIRHGGRTNSPINRCNYLLACTVLSIYAGIARASSRTDDRTRCYWGSHKIRDSSLAFSKSVTLTQPGESICYDPRIQKIMKYEPSNIHRDQDVLREQKRLYNCTLRNGNFCSGPYCPAKTQKRDQCYYIQHLKPFHTIIFMASFTVGVAQCLYLYHMVYTPLVRKA